MADTIVDTMNAVGNQPATQGWYFYGITAPDDRLADHLRGIPGMAGGGALDVIVEGAVAALGQTVPLSEYGPDALAARLEDVAWIEAAARHHHDTIATLHQRRALLPARFGAVYPSPDGLRAVLAEMHDTLRAHLERVEGCDEWEVRLYLDHPALLHTLDATHPALAALRQEMEAATPGHAYLLRRKLDDERDRAAAASLGALAAEAYGHLARQARASQAIQIHPRAQSARHAHPGGASAGPDGEDEVLRADCLVSRAEMEAFTAAMERFAAAHEGTRWTCTGPWPPYSFAAPLVAPTQPRPPSHGATEGAP